MGDEKANQLGLFEPAKAVEEHVAGEIMLNCIECDGQGKGFDIDLVKLISDAVSIPVIASSGVDSVDHFSEVFAKTNASAALAARFFHRKEIKKEIGGVGILKSFDEGFPTHNMRSWLFKLQLT
ncbi:hypothetical protein K1719_001476 [Acacia pycnantha]|nr:hypothetical protein K1719_001476 [Acacia pycnantha]